MLKGVCPKCGQVFHGWALQVREHQCCFCGTLLVVYEEKLEKAEGGRPRLDWTLSRARRPRPDRFDGGLL